MEKVQKSSNSVYYKYLLLRSLNKWRPHPSRFVSEFDVVTDEIYASKYEILRTVIEIIFKQFFVKFSVSLCVLVLT
jgi:hypothetical protein